MTQRAHRVFLAGYRTLASGPAAAPMTTDKAKDRARINVNEPTERAFWCQKFGCSETQLRNAVKMVGMAPNKVRTQLAQLK